MKEASPCRCHREVGEWCFIPDGPHIGVQRCLAPAAQEVGLEILARKATMEVSPSR